MGILGFIDTTFILTLGIILLISGCIMIYCYKRINTIENGLIQQGRILQEFIKNYNQCVKLNNVDNNCPSDICPLKTTDDINSLEIVNNDKILVSDDEDDDDDDDDEDDDDNDDDNDDDDDDDEDEDNSDNDYNDDNINLNIESNKDFIEDLSSEIVNIDVKSLAMEDITNPEFQEVQEVKQQDISTLDNLNIENLNLGSLTSNSKLIPISDNEGLDISKKNPNKLRVDDLRELVVSKNLISNEEANKLKKSELLKLLEQ